MLIPGYTTGEGPAYLARQLAKAGSGTCGPHSGSRPLQRVLAFCSAAVSHSSRVRASLYECKYVHKHQLKANPNIQQHTETERSWKPAASIWAGLPDSGEVTVDVNDVEVCHGGVAGRLA